MLKYTKSERMKRTIFILLLFVVAVVLMQRKNEPMQVSYYHWKNSFEANATQKLYIKVLDIDYHKHLNIIKTRFVAKPPKDFVPVVYITNRAMKEYKNLHVQVEKALKGLHFDELQVDCDWSLGSKKRYFAFLKHLKEDLGKKISATIRLHQVKYFQKTGVPPVDYGVLMYYNMSNVASFDTKNSILNNRIARAYHHNFERYLLKLKLALPIYSQGVQFRDKNIIDIFEGLKKSDFQKGFVKLKSDLFKVTKSRYFHGRYIYKDDIFRYEDVDKKAILKAYRDFFKICKNRYNEVILYRYEYKDRFKNLFDTN